MRKCWNLEIDQNIQTTKHGHHCVTENKNVQSELKKGYVRVTEGTLNRQCTL